VFALWERQSDWIDSLGTLQTERSFSVGRVATGGKLIYPWMAGDTRITAPRVRVVRRFESIAWYANSGRCRFH
jgi:hypothetical protein